MSLNVRQFRESVVKPALSTLGPGMAEVAAERLLLGTAAVESGFQHLRQIGDGPALGLFQMEPATYRDHWRWLDSQPDIRLRVLSLTSRGAGDPPDAGEMVWNLRFAAAMCRVHYRRAPEALPGANDPAGMAALWKLRYNSPLGKGTEQKFLDAWYRLVAPYLD